jgi:hypothetical protein
LQLVIPQEYDCEVYRQIWDTLWQMLRGDEVALTWKGHPLLVKRQVSLDTATITIDQNVEITVDYHPGEMTEMLLGEHPEWFYDIMLDFKIDGRPASEERALKTFLGLASNSADSVLKRCFKTMLLANRLKRLGHEKIITRTLENGQKLRINAEGDLLYVKTADGLELEFGRSKTPPELAYMIYGKNGSTQWAIKQFLAQYLLSAHAIIDGKKVTLRKDRPNMCSMLAESITLRRHIAVTALLTE